MGIEGGSLTDANGNALTSQVSGSQQALDVGVNVAGVQVDPRDIRALTITDVVTANQGGIWNITNISGTISLPTGASTAANQTTANASLSSIDGKLNSLGQKVSTASVPVVISSDQSPINVITTTSKGSLTDHSGTVSMVSISALAANANRKYLLIQNISAGKIYINFGAAASTTAASVFLAANGGSFIMEGEFLSTDQIFIIADSNSRAYVIKEG